MTDETISFENMPQMLSMLLRKVDELKERFESLYRLPEESERSQWFNVDEVCDYIPSHPRKQTIYSWTSKRMIPFHKKGRSIMFDKAEIDAWLQKSDYMKSVDEIEQEAKSFINNKK